MARQHNDQGNGDRKNQRNVSAWRPRVPGVVEVFHAHYTEYAYPMRVHDAWTLLIVDDGAVRYDLDRHEHGTPHDTVPCCRRTCRTTAPRRPRTASASASCTWTPPGWATS
ncbi:hypothetical protein STENM36S_05120 [Streptomyces tendae]